MGWTNTEPVLVFGLELCVRQSIHLHHWIGDEVSKDTTNTRVFCVHTRMPVIHSTHTSHTQHILSCSKGALIVLCDAIQGRSDSFLHDRTNLLSAVPSQHNKHLLRHLATTAHKHTKTKNSHFCEICFKRPHCACPQVFSYSRDIIRQPVRISNDLVTR